MMRRLIKIGVLLYCIFQGSFADQGEKKKLMQKNVISEQLNKINSSDRRIFSFQVDDNYTYFVKNLLKHNMELYESGVNGFRNFSGKKTDFLGALVGDLSFQSKLLAPITDRRGVAFHSVLSYRVNLFKFASSVYQYLHLQPMFLSFFYELINNIGDLSLKVVKNYYDYREVKLSLIDLEESLKLYQEIYKEGEYKLKFGLDDKSALAQIKLSMMENKLQQKQKRLNKTELEFALYNMIGNNKLDDVTCVNIGKIPFNSFSSFADFIEKNDYQLMAMKYRCDMLRILKNMDNIDRFAPAINLNMQWLFTGNFGDNTSVKNILTGELFDYKPHYTNSLLSEQTVKNRVFDYNIELNWNLSNILFGSPNRNSHYSSKLNIAKKKLVVYQSQLRAKAKQLYNQHLEEQNVFKFIDESLKEVQGLVDNNMRAYKSGSIELKSLYESIISLNRLKSQKLRQQGAIYLSAAMINRYCLYHFSVLRDEINKYCLTI